MKSRTIRRTDLAANLAAALRTVDQRVQVRIVRLGYADIRPGHLALLLNLDRTGAQSAELARRADMTKQSMAEIVRDLEQLDYVERRPDPNDGRARLVQPTGRGLMLIAHARQAIAEVEADTGRRIGRDRYVELQRALVELAGTPSPDDDATAKPLVAVPMAEGAAAKPRSRR